MAADGVRRSLRPRPGTAVRSFLGGFGSGKHAAQAPGRS